MVKEYSSSSSSSSVCMYVNSTQLYKHHMTVGIATNVLYKIIVNARLIVN